MSKNGLYIEIITKAGDLSSKKPSNICDISLIKKHIPTMIAFTAMVENLAYDSGMDVIKLGDAIVHPANLIDFTHLRALCVKMRNCGDNENVVRYLTDEEMARISQYAIAIEAGSLYKEHLMLRQINCDAELRRMFNLYGKLCNELEALNDGPLSDILEQLIINLTIVDNIVVNRLESKHGFEIESRIPSNWTADDLLASIFRNMPKYTHVADYFRQKFNDEEFSTYVTILDRFVTALKSVNNRDINKMLHTYVVNFISNEEYYERTKDRLLSLKCVSDSIYEKHFRDLIPDAPDEIFIQMHIENIDEEPITYPDFISKYNDIKDDEVVEVNDDMVIVYEKAIIDLVDKLAYCYIHNGELCCAELWLQNLLKNATSVELAWKIFKLYDSGDYDHINKEEFKALIEQYNSLIPKDFSIIKGLDCEMSETLNQFISAFCKLDGKKPSVKPEGGCHCNCNSKENVAELVENICSGLQTIYSTFESCDARTLITIIMNAFPSAKFNVEYNKVGTVYSISKDLIETIFRNSPDMDCTIKHVGFLSRKITCILNNKTLLEKIGDLRKSCISVRNNIKHRVGSEIESAMRGPFTSFPLVFDTAINMYDRMAYNPFALLEVRGNRGEITRDMIYMIIEDNVGEGIQRNSLFKALFSREYDLGYASSLLMQFVYYVKGFESFIIENASEIYNESMQQCEHFKKGN